MNHCSEPTPKGASSRITVGGTRPQPRDSLSR